MTTLAETTHVTVREPQLRVEHSEVLAALGRVRGRSAVEARARLRFGPGRTCEQVARMLDTALVEAERRGLAVDTLMVGASSAVAAEDIVRVRRKAHGVADWISSPTTDVTIVVGSEECAGTPVAPPTEEPAPSGPSAPETEAELAVREALYDVIDPDLGVNIVDLGFVRRVELAENGVATITMTLTSAACPLSEAMESQIRSVLSATGTEFAVRWEWQPAWRPRDISEDGREQLQAIGFSAF